LKARRLVIRSVLHYWKTGAVVAFGVAVATAVILGSLVVGDSVTGSVRRVARTRLGEIDAALVSPRFCRESLVKDIAASVEPKDRVRRIVPVILEQGALKNEETGGVLPIVNVIGIGSAFWQLYPGGASPALGTRRAAVNEALASDLGLHRGSDILLTVGRRGAVASQTLFGRREREDTVRTLRLELAAILPDPAGGAFSLAPGTATPRNLFLSRDWLARRLDKAGHVNGVLVQSSPAARDRNDGPLRSALRSVCTLADHGLRIVPNEKQGYLSLESEALVLVERQVEQAFEAAKQSGARSARTSVYLADTIRIRDSKKRSIAYAVIAGVEPLKPLPMKHGWGGELGNEFMLLNTWAAMDLGAKLGDRLEVLYRVPERDGSYTSKTLSLTLRGVVDLKGPAADPKLVPRFEGITEAKTIDEWDPPFPIDLKHKTKLDDDYWLAYRTTPKAFVSLEVARAIWKAGWSENWVTSVRIAPPDGQDLQAFEKEFAATLLKRLTPDDAGLAFRPVRRLAEQAAKGSTDFAWLFLGMSMFLVFSGAGLAGMLMRLAVERRAAEMGMMLASGFRGRAAARLVLWEGATLSLVGAVAGVPLGVLYAHGIIQALRTWWIDAVRTPALWLHVKPGTILIGFGCGLAAGLISVWWGVRRLRGRRVLELLSGWRAMAAVPTDKRARRAAVAFLAVALTAAAALVVLSVGTATIEPPGAFFGCGAALLVAGLSGCYLLLVRMLHQHGNSLSLVLLAMRNAAAHRGRSMLAVGLLGCATFVVVTVAANERDFGQTDVANRLSGTGGFSLRAVSALPVHYDFGTKAGRAALGFPAEDEKIWEGAQVFSFLMSSGEDISCLNLAKPSAPTILGVRKRMIERGGFSVRVLKQERAKSPWTLLAEPGVLPIPAFGDSESVRWQLHKGLGDVRTVPDEAGRPVEMRFVGLVSASILAGELLVSEDNFRGMYPAETAPRYFLIDTPPGMSDEVAGSLRRNLGETGVEVRSTREILNDLIGVQNTYLMTFLALGGLGVLLGTVGLVVVLLRNALERRGEFALMLATGFGRPYLAGLLIVENAGLLVAGLLCGTVAALAAVAPQLASVESRVNWAALCALLLGIMVAGVASCAATAATTVRGRLIRALRAE